MNLCKTCGTICPFDDERTECAAYAPMTNENWFISLPTEEKAKVLNDLYWGFGYKAKLYYNLEPTKESFEKWLKQPHTESDKE